MAVILTEEQKAGRKEIWDKMTAEERQAAEKKKCEIIESYGKKEDEIYKRLEEEGRISPGLDGSYPEIVQLDKERRECLHDFLVSLFGEEFA